MKVNGHFFEHTDNAFDFLESIETYIHVDVQKLYPDAELLRFLTTRLDENTLEMFYHSERSMGDLAEGLIDACVKHFNQKANIRWEPLTDDGKSERFLILLTN